MSADPHRELIKALATHLGPINDLTAQTRDWASVMFTGMRHLCQFSVPWSAEIETLLSNLADAELPMRDHFVADLRVIAMRRVDDVCHVSLEALTIEEA